MSELFFGHCLSPATMVADECGPPVPELARQMTLSSCRHDPVPVAVKALVGRFATGALVPGDVLADSDSDSGYARRTPARSRRTATATAHRPRRHCSASARSHAVPAPTRSRPMT